MSIFQFQSKPCHNNIDLPWRTLRPTVQDCWLAVNLRWTVVTSRFKILHTPSPFARSVVVRHGDDCAKFSSGVRKVCRRAVSSSSTWLPKWVCYGKCGGLGRVTETAKLTTVKRTLLLTPPEGTTDDWSLSIRFGWRIVPHSLNRLRFSDHFLRNIRYGESGQEQQQKMNQKTGKMNKKKTHTHTPYTYGCVPIVRQCTKRMETLEGECSRAAETSRGK